MVAVASAVAACGGSGASPPDAAKLLSQTFGTNLDKIHSGNLSLSLDADLKGISTLGGKPLSLQLSGPFTDSAGPAFDFNATVTVSGNTIPIGIISSGKALYLELAGTDYSMPASVNSALQRETATSSGGGPSNVLSKLGIDPSSWLTDPKVVGSATVGGVSTEHLTAQVDVAQFMSDALKVVSSNANLAGGSTGELGSINPTAVASAVKSAQVDIYSGASDSILREFRLAVSFVVPQGFQSKLGGLTGGSLDLDATITNLNAPETIKAPSSAKPFSSLLGGGGSLLPGL